MTNTLSRMANRAKRQVITRVGPVNRLVQNAHEAKVRDYQQRLPKISSSQTKLVAELDRAGVAVTHLDNLAIPGTDDIKNVLEEIKGSLAERDPQGASSIKPSRAELIANVRLWQWGLNHRLLDIAENYIGLPVRYYGAAVFRGIADGKTVGTRQWHRDIEDHKVFKILVWMNDVSPQGGAFQYIPRPISDPAVRQLRYVSGYVTDDRVRSIVPESDWVKATGPQWTAVMADPARILHRGSPSVDRDRFSVTFTWTSRSPIKTMPPAEDFTDAEEERLREALDARQLASLPARRH